MGLHLSEAHKQVVVVDCAQWPIYKLSLGSFPKETISLSHDIAETNDNIPVIIVYLPSFCLHLVCVCMCVRVCMCMCVAESTPCAC